MTNIPQRSPLGIPYRSLLGVLGNSSTFPVPEPPPIFADTPCSAMVREICEPPADCPPLPTFCLSFQEVTTEMPVCDPDDPRYPFSGCFSYAITLFGLRTYASKDEFPIFLLDASGAPIFEIPDSTCPRDQWRNYFSMVSDDLAVGNLIDFQDPYSDTGPTAELLGFQHTFFLISNTQINVPPKGELLGFRCTSQPSCPIGEWYNCLPYTAIQNGPLNQYAARFLGTGFSSLDNLLRFSGTGGGGQYDGDHAVAFFSSTEVLTPGVLWDGDADGGQWINDNLTFICDVRAPSGTNTGEVRDSTIPAYNGVRQFVDGGGSEGAWRWLTNNLWFEGSAAGQILINEGAPSGIQVFGSGPEETVDIPAPNFNLRIQGTGSYDGDYQTGASSTIIGPPFGALWLFRGGDLENVDFVGTTAGSWTDIDNPTRTGLILDVESEGLGGITANFSITEPERSGSVTGVRSSATTVISADHDGLVGGSIRLWSDEDPKPNYDQERLEIIGVRVDQIDVPRLLPLGPTQGRVTIAAPGI